MAVNKTVILDSNIIIYTGLKEQHQLRNWLKTKNIYVSDVSRLEVLGYHKLTSKDQNYFKYFFKSCQIIPISFEVIESAIDLRQIKKMSLGDSIIAATALRHGLVLTTSNTKDFRHIEALKTINPI